MTGYDDDIILWSEEQSVLLRRMADAERRNEGAPDWPNVIEEIEAVGSERQHAVESLLVQALIHMLKAAAWPLARGTANWRAEAIRLRGDAAARFVPSMRQRVDLQRLYVRAISAVPEINDGQPPLPLPQACPVTLDELLAVSEP
jgi:hypothetical protein